MNSLFLLIGIGNEMGNHEKTGSLIKKIIDDGF